MGYMTEYSHKCYFTYPEGENGMPNAPANVNGKKYGARPHYNLAPPK